MAEILEFLLNVDVFVLSVTLLCCSSVVLVGLLILAVKLQMLVHQLNIMSPCLNGTEKTQATANDFHLCGMIPAKHKVTISEVNNRTHYLREPAVYSNDTDAGSWSGGNEPEYLTVIPSEQEAEEYNKTTGHSQHNWKCHATERCCNTVDISTVAEDEDGYITAIHSNNALLEEGTFPGKLNWKGTMTTGKDSINGTSPSAQLAEDYPEYLTVIHEADVQNNMADILDEVEPNIKHFEHQTGVNNNGRADITSIPTYGNTKCDESLFSYLDGGEKLMDKVPIYINQQEVLQAPYMGDNDQIYANSEIQQECDVGNRNLAFHKDEYLPMYVNKSVIRGSQ